MTNQQQIEFILEQIRKMREKNQPDMMEIWRRQQEEYRKHILVRENRMAGAYMAMAPGQIKTDTAFTHTEEFHETDNFPQE
ncbi:hypothetical protein [Escherichia coli]|uniref:hypothetical protein n=1 Tax=Escherichia coli TaxID=562 RepID=UPI001FCEA33E|nr:hypothetical protein [Escherichia coli]